MKNRYPTPSELYALEREARRQRSEEIARLIKAGTNKVRAFFARTSNDRNVKGLRHA